MARHMVTQYGMSEKLGLGTFEEPRTPMFLNVPMPQDARSFSERTAQAIDQEIAQLLAAAQKRVRMTLLDRRGALEALARLLLEKEVVDGAGLSELLAQHPANDAARPQTAEIKAA